MNLTSANEASPLEVRQSRPSQADRRFRARNTAGVTLMVSAQIDQSCLPVMRGRGRLNLVTAIDREAAITAIDAGQLSCGSGGERRVLRLAASIAGGSR